MSRILTNIANTNPVDANYPSGAIRDKNVSVNPIIIGTPITEKIYGDIIQFFQKLLRTAGIVVNDLPDNEGNGYQLYQALDFINGGMLTKQMNIGAWNMDSAATINVAHGLTYAKIRGVQAFILSDANPLLSDINKGGFVDIANDNVSLARTTDGVFDNTDYDGAGNRGYIIIKYIL